MKIQSIWRRLRSRVPPLALAFASIGLAFAVYGGWRELARALWRAGISTSSSGALSNACGMLIIGTFTAMLVLQVANSHALCLLERRAEGSGVQAFLIRGLRTLMYVAHAFIWIGPGLASVQAFHLTAWCCFAAFVALFYPPPRAPIPKARLVAEGEDFP